MKKLIDRAALPLLAALALGACSGETDSASESVTDGTAATPPTIPVGGAPALTPEQQQEQMQMLAELQSIDQQLGPLQDQALADPELVTKQDALVETVESAMEEAVPGTREKRAEFDQLLVAYQSAQAAADQEKLAELTPRLRTLDMELGEAQNMAMERDDVRGAVEAFQTELAAKMRELDGEVGSLLDRREELTDELERMMGAVSGG